MNPQLPRHEIEQLYERHASAVRRFLLGVLRDADQADEALQQTFVRLMEQGHEARAETMQGWIYKVAYNEAMALRRRRNVDVRAAQALALDPRLVAGPSDSLAAEDAALRDEELRRAQDALADLPAAQAEVVRLRFVESQTFAQIAAKLEVPLGTALTRMRLALTRLRRILK